MAHFVSVFVSATTKDLGRFRDAVADKLLALDLHPVVQKHFETDYRTLRDKLRDKVSACDAVIHLAGFAYGAEPHGRPDGAPRRSYTQLEFEIAVALGKPVYRFLANPECPFDQAVEEP